MDLLVDFLIDAYQIWYTDMSWLVWNGALLFWLSYNELDMFLYKYVLIDQSKK